MEDKIWNYKNIEQQYDSKLTSINSSQLPKTVKFVEPLLKSGEQWLDIGGGRFDNSVEYFKKSGVELLVYDPFNRTHEHNAKVISRINQKKCDGVMVNNVLNVIAEKENRKRVIEQAYQSLKEDGLAFFVTYQGNKSGVSKVTKQTKESNCFQMNQKTVFYVDEIKYVFGENVQKKGDYIIASKVLSADNELDNLKINAKKLGLSRNKDVGKFIGGNIYIHKDYANILPQNRLTEALNTLKENVFNFDYTIIRYNKDKDSFAFIKSPDFDFNDEPIVGDSILISNDNSLKFTPQKKDPQIYHHKWLFVKDNYKNFDIKKSLERTIFWKEKMGTNKTLSSKIGTQSIWNSWLKENILNKPKL